MSISSIASQTSNTQTSLTSRTEPALANDTLSPARTTATADKPQTSGADTARISGASLLQSRALYMSQFYPVRAGMSAAALAAAATSPGLESSSSGLSLAQTAADARQRIDQKYVAMQASGEPYGTYNALDQDANSLLGDLDRRSLYAVSSNTEGLFSQDEQNLASAAMSKQLNFAMGHYSGPQALSNKFFDPYAADDTARYKAGIAFLQQVSADEKASTAWAQQRNGLQDLVDHADEKRKPGVWLTLFNMLEKLNQEKDRKNDAVPTSPADDKAADGSAASV